MKRTMSHMGKELSKVARCLSMIGLLSVLLVVGLQDRVQPTVSRAGSLAEVSLAKALLDDAFRKVLAQDDFRQSAFQIVEVAVKLDPAYGLAMVRKAEPVFREGSPTDEWSFHGSLAELVAPYDKKLRGGLLRTAIKTGQKRLDMAENWVTKTPPPGAAPFGNPQKKLDNDKTILSLRVALWRILMEAKRDTVSRLKKLMATAESKGHTAGDCPTPIIYFLKTDLAGLDPVLLVKAWPANEKECLPKFGFDEATAIGPGTFVMRIVVAPQ